MKSVLGGLVLCIVVVGTTYAEDDPFNGSWKLDVAKSTSTSSRYPLPTVEVLTLEVPLLFVEMKILDNAAVTAVPHDVHRFAILRHRAQDHV